LGGLREYSAYETNLSTEQHTKKTHSWVSRSHGHTRRTQGDQAAPRQGAKEIDRDRAAQARAHLEARDVAAGQGKVSEIGPPEKTTGIPKDIACRPQATIRKFRRDQQAE
jgi:hypothetical protein